MIRFRRAMTQTEDGALTFVDGPQSWAARLAFLGGGGVLAISAVAAVAWLAGEQPEPVWAALAGIAALAMVAILGIMIMRLGLAPAKRLWIDPVSGRVRLWQVEILGRPRVTEVALGELSPPRIYTEPPTPDFPDQPLLEIVLTDRDWIRIESFHSEEGARACALRIAHLIRSAQSAKRAA